MAEQLKAALPKLATSTDYTNYLSYNGEFGTRENFFLLCKIKTWLWHNFPVRTTLPDMYERVCGMYQNVTNWTM